MGVQIFRGAPTVPLMVFFASLRCLSILELQYVLLRHDLRRMPVDLPYPR